MRKMKYNEFHCRMIAYNKPVAHDKPSFRSVDALPSHVFACLNRPLPIELLQASVLKRG